MGMGLGARVPMGRDPHPKVRVPISRGLGARVMVPMRRGLGASFRVSVGSVVGDRAFSPL